MRVLATALLSMWAFFAIAQPPVQEPKGSFKLDLGLPLVTGSKAFSKSFKGLAQLGLSYQHNVAKGFVIGAGAKYNYFELDQFQFEDPMRGSLHNVAPFLKLGYETFLNERLSVDAGIRGGYSWMYSFNDSTRVKNGGPHQSAGAWMEPHAGVYIIADGRASFSLNVGYTFIFNEFTPDFIGLDDFVWHRGGIMQYFTLGFGFSYYFGIRPVQVGVDTME